MLNLYSGRAFFNLSLILFCNVHPVLKNIFIVTANINTRLCKYYLNAISVKKKKKMKLHSF